MTKLYKKINNCRICKSKNLINIIDLNKQHIQGLFQKKKHTKIIKKKIPLQLVLCKNCSLVQTKYTVLPNALYKDYWYSSGINHTMTDHLRKLASEGVKTLKNQKKINCRVLDIGCNDGTLLKFFPKSYLKIGIDPSVITKNLKNKNLTIINDFFPSTKILSKFKNSKFNLITSIAMFYDINNPNKFVSHIKNILDEKGIWVFELAYLIDILKNNSYDTICHEHLVYYSITTLKYLMENSGMKIFKIKFNEINGGSVRCYVTHSSNDSYDKRKNLDLLKKTLQRENKLKIKTTIPYNKFFKQILKMKYELNKLIKNLKINGKEIHIYGASTKGNTIIQWQGINNKIIKFAADRNPKKWGAKTIGNNINIISEETSKKLKPAYYLVLPWHFKKEFLKREKKFLNSGGKMIFPLPKIKIY